MSAAEISAETLALADALLARAGAAGTVGAVREELPDDWLAALTALVERALLAGRTLQLVMPDDQDLPELSSALDLELRPLCLILPQTAFAVPITLRATLSLLRSRLGRDDAGDGAAPDCVALWARQRERLNERQELWDAALAWSRGSERTAWPQHIADLFPAQILPAAQAVKFAGAEPASEITVLVAPERYDGDIGAALTARVGVIALTPRHLARGTALPALIDENSRLRHELELLAQELADLELELATVQGEMAGFTSRYYELVGRRMVELDALQAKFAILKAAQMPVDAEASAAAQAKAEQAQRSQQEQWRYAEAEAQGEARPDADAPFRPSADLKKLFRQIAQKIHPDRAASEADRAWRTQLMSEANRAYRNGDEAALHEVMALWNEGPRRAAGPVHATVEASDALTQSLLRQVEQMRQRLAAIQNELDQLLGSRLYELFIAARLARRQERDLLQEMANLLDLQIAAAQEQLDALAENDSSDTGEL